MVSVRFNFGATLKTGFRLTYQGSGCLGDMGSQFVASLDLLQLLVCLLPLRVPGMRQDSVSRPLRVSLDELTGLSVQEAHRNRQ